MPVLSVRVDLDAVRTFVAAADVGQFQHAAADLAVTQQAVSKRIAALERDLGVRLFTRTPRGAQLTIDGQAFLPHARELLRVEQRAADSVRPGRRALRVDVISRRIAPAGLLRDFHRAHPDVELDVVTLADSGADTAIAAVAAGTIDASFRAAVRSDPRAPRWHRGRPRTRRAASAPDRPGPPAGRGERRHSRLACAGTASGSPASCPAPSGPPTMPTSPPSSG